MKWFYAKDGQQIGPVDFSEIQKLHAEGQLSGESLVWEQGSPNWVALSSVLGGATPTPSASPVSLETSPSIPSSGRLKLDYGDFLCWGIVGVLVPCIGFFIYVALVVLHCMEFFEARKAVAAGSVPESDYSKMHPVFFILGFICCGGILYPLFMYYRNKSGYFKAQPYAVIVSIIVVVISIIVGIFAGMAQLAAKAAAEGMAG
jgi:hypothetical protein